MTVTADSTPTPNPAISYPTIANLQKLVFDNACAHGFWDSDRVRHVDYSRFEPDPVYYTVNETCIPTKLMLICSEAAEALEAYRNEENYKEHLGEEMADIVIRCMDLCGALEIDLESEIIKKHEKNIGRPYKHGNKRC